MKYLLNFTLTLFNNYELKSQSKFQNSNYQEFNYFEYLNNAKMSFYFIQLYNIIVLHYLLLPRSPFHLFFHWIFIVILFYQFPNHFKNSIRLIQFHKFNHLLYNPFPIIIGVSGPTASGKSTVVKKLNSHFNSNSNSGTTNLTKSNLDKYFHKDLDQYSQT